MSLAAAGSFALSDEIKASIENNNLFISLNTEESLATKRKSKLSWLHY
jgi:hypothetical protein